MPNIQNYARPTSSRGSIEEGRRGECSSGEVIGAASHPSERRNTAIWRINHQFSVDRGPQGAIYVL